MTNRKDEAVRLSADVSDLLSEDIRVVHEFGYQIDGVLIGIVTEPSVIVEMPDGRREVYALERLASIAPRQLR